jgi:hypothetical protein
LLLGGEHPFAGIAEPDDHSPTGEPGKTAAHRGQADHLVAERCCKSTRASTRASERLHDFPDHLAADADPHLVFIGAADDIDRPMRDVIFRFEYRLDDMTAADLPECDPYGILLAAAEGGSERFFLCGGDCWVERSGLAGRAKPEQRGDNRQRQDKIVAHDVSPFTIWRRSKCPQTATLDTQFIRENIDSKCKIMTML